jgi:hypothetical protein
VDEGVLAAVGRLAEPFIDSPNDVIRNLLDLPQRDRPSCAVAPRATRPGAGRGSGEYLREADYELPILKALHASDGAAARPEVMDAIELALGPRFSESDREPLQNGEERWRNRTSFCRRRMLERGYVLAGSRRGIWELSEQGEERLRQLEFEADHEQGPPAGEGRAGDQIETRGSDVP